MVIKQAIGSNRLMLAVPLLMLAASMVILVSGYAQTGEWFQRSIELKGGTLLTIKDDSPHDVAALEASLSQQFGKVTVREIRSFSGSGLTIQLDASVDSQQVLSALQGLGISTVDSSVETVGPSLGESFWLQAQLGLVIAFLLMGIIVFVIFRTLVPSTAVILAALLDIAITLAAMQALSLELSLASLAALLMLIGYSIDTDILLTTRVLKVHDKPIGERTWGAFKTGMTMTLTTLAVLLAILLTTTSLVLLAISSVLFIGLAVDIINTWLMNATILRWYAERKGLK